MVPQPDLTHAQFPLVLAIDIGSSSVRAIVFDATGRQLIGSGHREKYRLEITADGGSMCDPLRIRRLTAKCVRKACEHVGKQVADVSLVGISCHWHSLMGLNQDGYPITPVYMWSDKRSSGDAETLAAELDDNATHQRTGCRLHSSYWPAKLRWLYRSREEIVENAATWCGLADWLFLADGAPLKTSVSMASATGLFDTTAQKWDTVLLNHLHLATSDLPELTDRSAPFPSTSVHPDLLPARLNATWYPAIGDGAAANIGAGAVGRDRVALTIGTSGAIRLARPVSSDATLPPSLFRYLIDTNTEVLGGALSNGGNMMNWLASITGVGDQKAAMAASAQIPPDSHGLTVLPFFAGERAPSWQDTLGGTISGMSLDTSATHIHRSMLEATALRFASVYEAMQPFAEEQHSIVANGGALLQSPLWMQITADALGHEIWALQSRLEASARGTAVSALQSAGVLQSIRTEPHVTHRYAPLESYTSIYTKARKRQEALERTLLQWERNND